MYAMFYMTNVNMFKNKKEMRYHKAKPIYRKLIDMPKSYKFTDLF